MHRPGATLGILGGGQLARMIALAARPLGYRIAVLDPDPNCGAAPVADIFVQGAWNSLEGARALAEVADIITLDTEHIPAEILYDIAKTVPVSPAPRVLEIIQDRRNQREFLSSIEAPQTRHAFIDSVDDLRSAVGEVGFPCVLKTRWSGYDGKGQVRLDSADDIENAWATLNETPSVLEAFVDFTHELSVILARNEAGEISVYPLAENVHRQHILYTTCAPARLPETVGEAAQGIARQIADSLAHEGVMAVEFFLTAAGEVLVNEIAPRVHNSGHYTLGACETSQFEQHARAVCGLPLGSAEMLRPAVMLNLLGDLWGGGEPDWAAVLADPDVHLHLYGKTEARPGRKMAHLTILDADVETALAKADVIHGKLSET